MSTRKPAVLFVVLAALLLAVLAACGGSQAQGAPKANASSGGASTAAPSAIGDAAAASPTPLSTASGADIERIAHQMGERLGEDQVAAHHGSLSKERRQRVESRLRAGDLRALVATASLELGIDIGPVELVCQIGSPRSFATFLQRVGRSNHTRFGTPRGVLYPTSRDELVECAALLRGTRAGRLDAIIQPVAPLDIVAQQIVAECAAEDWSEDELFDLIRRAIEQGDLRPDVWKRWKAWKTFWW